MTDLPDADAERQEIDWRNQEEKYADHGNPEFSGDCTHMT